MRADRVDEQIVVDGRAPGAVDDDTRDRVESPADIHHAVGKEARAADDDGVARLEQIDQRGLHAAAAGGRQCQGGPIRGLEDLAQQPSGLLHDGQEVRILVSRQRRDQRLEHTWVQVAWPGRHKDALGWKLSESTPSLAAASKVVATNAPICLVASDSKASLD